MIRIGSRVVIDGWRHAVVCDLRTTGFYTVSGDNRREYFDFNDDQVSVA